MPLANLKHFYIPEEQSIYLLSQKDAQKLKRWIQLCIEQLQDLGFANIELIGKGAFGFVFAGAGNHGKELVFKFSRADLPKHVQDRLEEEAFMLSCVDHVFVPKLVQFHRTVNQSILVMERARGEDLEQFSLRTGPLQPRLIVKIAAQLTEVLLALRQYQQNGVNRPIVHGDIKPSNIVFDSVTETIGLIDWGSSVFAQVDSEDQYIANNVMDLMSGELHQTNARLGDVYFIGEEQLNGGLSSPRFDEQGLASTLYAMASGQSCRFGTQAIPASSLGLPKEMAEVLNAMLSPCAEKRRRGGDYLLRNMRYMQHLVFCGAADLATPVPLIPARHHTVYKEIETVVYSSRKSFLQGASDEVSLHHINDAQFDHYYKNFMQGMGETEKAFVAAVSRIGKYPVVGGIVVRWRDNGVDIDSSLNIYDNSVQSAFDEAVNNVVHLARAIKREGVFKSCMFNARDTLHIDRDSAAAAFIPDESMRIGYDKSLVSVLDDNMHSYFEDGKDPDELLTLPSSMMAVLKRLNQIHHTGCIVFEALETHLKIHSYYKLLDLDKEAEFRECLQMLVSCVPQITGLGLSGFMKLPFKDTRFFPRQDSLPQRYYPKNPRQLALP